VLNVVVLDTLSEETNSISSILNMAFTRRELPIKRLDVVHELSLLLNALEQIEQCNVFIASFNQIREEYIDFAQSLRYEKENVFIVFVVDKKTDIALCVRPSVRPSGILFIPLDRMRVYQTISEIYNEHLRITSRDEHPPFIIKNGGDYYSINIDDISFFEATGKKIAVKTRGQEILFYSNFETILKQLPDWFVRCHKGFVVNTKQIAQASFTEMTLTLNDKSRIPISRTYRDDLRAIINSLGV